LTFAAASALSSRRTADLPWPRDSPQWGALKSTCHRTSTGFPSCRTGLYLQDWTYFFTAATAPALASPLTVTSATEPSRRTTRLSLHPMAGRATPGRPRAKKSGGIPFSISEGAGAMITWLVARDGFVNWSMATCPESCDTADYRTHVYRQPVNGGPIRQLDVDTNLGQIAVDARAAASPPRSRGSSGGRPRGGRGSPA